MYYEWQIYYNRSDILAKSEIAESIKRLVCFPDDEDKGGIQICFPEKDVTTFLAKALISKASGGDLSAIKEIRAITESAEAKENEKFFLPAKAIASSFIDAYRDILKHGHTEYVFYGGRGSTKSSFISMMILEMLLSDEEIHAVICRRVKDTLRDSVYAQIKWAAIELSVEDLFEFKTSPLEIQVKKTGQKIYFRGADDPAKLKSIKVPFGHIGILWFEELDQFEGEEQIRSIEQSVIRGGSAYIFKSFNPPRTIASWTNRFLKTPKETRLVHKSTYKDVPPEWLGKTFIEEAEHLKKVNPEAYEHEYEGNANAEGGNVFANVSVRTMKDDEIDAFDRVYMGIDWGWYPDPFRFIKAYYIASERRLFIFDEISGNKLPNREIAVLLRAHGVKDNERITADSAGEGPKSIKDFKEMGFSVRRARKGAGSVEYSMKWLASLAEIVIDPVRCPHTLKEFLEYEYEQNAEGEVISGYPDKNNHSIDAVRYALEEVWRKRGR